MPQTLTATANLLRKTGDPAWRNPTTGIAACCARRERPRRRRDAEQRDEFAPSQVEHGASSRPGVTYMTCSHLH
jgi:hypothetical protein